MMRSAQQIKQQLSVLIEKGMSIWQRQIHGMEEDKGKSETFKYALLVSEYQDWYTDALPVVRELLPDRLDEFIEQYKTSACERAAEASRYTISDYLCGIRLRSPDGVDLLDHKNAFLTKFHMQLVLVSSIKARMDSALQNIRGLLQADLYDDALSAAKALHNTGHLRAAGAVSGVALEAHLRSIAANHSISLSKPHPTIADLNEELKKANVLEVPTWRLVQHLGDLRNLCVHEKGREPTKEEVDDLIRGTEKITKTVF